MKNNKAVVAGPAGAVSAKPLFWPSMLSAVSFFFLFFYLFFFMSIFSHFDSFYILPLVLLNLPQFIYASINNAHCACHPQTDLAKV